MLAVSYEKTGTCPLERQALLGDWLGQFRRRHPEARVDHRLGLRLGKAVPLTPQPATFLVVGDGLEGSSLAEATRFFQSLPETYPRSQVAIQVTRRTLDSWRLENPHRFPCVFLNIWLVEIATAMDLAKRASRHLSSAARALALLRAAWAFDRQTRFVLLEVGG